MIYRSRSRRSVWPTTLGMVQVWVTGVTARLSITHNFVQYTIALLRGGATMEVLMETPPGLWRTRHVIRTFL